MFRDYPYLYALGRATSISMQRQSAQPRLLISSCHPSAFEEAYQTTILGLLDLYRQHLFHLLFISQTYLLYCQLLPCREGGSLPLNTSICFSDGSPIISRRFTTSKNCYSSATSLSCSGEVVRSGRAIAWISIALPSLTHASPNGLDGDSPHAYPQ